MLSTWGWRQAFIAQHKDPEAPEPRQQALWTADLVVRAGATLLLALAAPLVARGFGEPDLAALVAVSGLFVLGQGLRHPALLEREREMQFRAIAWVELSGAVAGLVVAVAGAVVLRSVWALVLGQVMAAMVSAATSYVLLGPPARPLLDDRLIRQGFRFARGMFGISTLGWVMSQADNAIVGAVLGAGALGLFAIAYRLCEIPKVMQDTIITRAVYPFYVKALAHGVGALRDAWTRTGRYTLWLLWLVYLPLIVAPDLLLSLLFGARWTAAAEALRVMAVAGILRGVSTFLTPVLMSLQQPGLDFRIKGVETVVFVGVATWGALVAGTIEAVALAGVAAWGLGLVVRMAAVCRKTGAHAADLLRAWRAPLAGLAGALLPVALLGRLAPAALLALLLVVLLGLALWLERDRLRQLRGAR